MDHASRLVDLVDNSGHIVGTKKRADIDKRSDLYHTIFVVLCTPDHKIVLSKIPERQDLPNMYPHRYGAAAATIRRHKETAAQAARRAIKNELHIAGAALDHLDDDFLFLPGDNRSYISVFKLIHQTPTEYSQKDIAGLSVFSPKELQRTSEQHKDQFAPAFLAIWQKHHDALVS